MLSQSVATAIKLTGGEVASETAKFVEMCDKWFDAMNVHNYTHGIHTRKNFQLPYTSVEDERLNVSKYCVQN